jgi:hypothetical protein
LGVDVGVGSRVAVGLGVDVAVAVGDGFEKTRALPISFMLCKPVIKAQIAIQLEIAPIISKRIFFDSFLALLSFKVVSFISPPPIF